MVNFKCDECGLNTYCRDGDYVRFNTHFCSRSCRAKYSNKNRVLIKGKTKQHNCKKCNITLLVSNYVSNHTVICDDCRLIDGKISTGEYYINGRKKYKQIEIQSNCKDCGVAMLAFKKRKYCKQCLSAHNKINGQKAGRIGGLKSAKSQQRRSKNEILFATKLKEMLQYEMIYNQPYFMDKCGSLWDADIIIPKLKIAIHWNGPWHYKQITKNNSLSQIQNRDKIKHSVIEHNGFTNYIVRDNGSYNEEKVYNEIKIFISHLHDLFGKETTSLVLVEELPASNC